MVSTRTRRERRGTSGSDVVPKDVQFSRHAEEERRASWGPGRPDGEVLERDADVWQGTRRSQRHPTRATYPNEKDDDIDEVADHMSVDVKVEEVSGSSDGEDKEQVPETHYSVPRTRFRKRLRSPSQERQHTLPSSKTTRASAKTKRPAIDDNPEIDHSDDSGSDEDLRNRRRYSLRTRRLVDRYSPKSQDPQDGDDEEEEEEEDEEDGVDDEGAHTEHRYKLRERAHLHVEKYNPAVEDKRSKRPAVKKLARHTGMGRRRASSRNFRSFGAGHLSDDDIPDLDAGLDWRALQGPAQGLAAGAIARTPGPAGSQPAGHPHEPRQPWEVGAAGAGGRSDRPGNAEITPLEVDPSVTFDQVGGLGHYISLLKEMIFLPLIYPELYEKFNVTPPRGVLFYGPPGTGKTLVARALAASASRSGRKVSFFMRKGADILSKWVGEAERQMRLLFEEAMRRQPSIIFFDEIDGLAPVRSSKQDQIHNSIVSTLLALMDGLDSRGQVVVIGATNRIDALDGALRRPGRFDRELIFPLPNLAARSCILDIHTRKWAEPPSAELREELAQACVGYCGADLKALCTEASLRALRRHYPQIYETDDKLLIDPQKVSVTRHDFLAAAVGITPASHRSAAAHARPLPRLVEPVLQPRLAEILEDVSANFPAAAAGLAAAGEGVGAQPGNRAMVDTLEEEDEDDLIQGMGRAAGRYAMQQPRLLLCGECGAGQSHLAPALLYALEGLPVHAIGLSSLLSDASARSPEEAIVHAVLEARRAAPAILYLPHLQLWWETAPASLQATLWELLSDLPGDVPLLFMATADVPKEDLPPAAASLFHSGLTSVVELGPPSALERAAFFQEITQSLAFPPLPPPRKQVRVAAPQLPRAPEAIEADEQAAAMRREAAERALYEEDAATLRTLRMALRGIITAGLLDRRFRDFIQAPRPDEDPEFWERVNSPMDLATVLARVDGRQYSTVENFLRDVQQIVTTVQQLWGDDPAAFREVSKAHMLVDEIRCAVTARVPAELLAKLEAIKQKGGPAPPPPGVVPDEIPVLGQEANKDEAGDAQQGPHLMEMGGKRSIRDATGREVQVRGSRRLQGEEVGARIIFDDPEEAIRRSRKEKREQEKREGKVGKVPDDVLRPTHATGSAAPQASPLPCSPRTRAVSAEPGKVTTPTLPTVRATSAQPQATPFHSVSQKGNEAVPYKNGKTHEAHVQGSNPCTNELGGEAAAVDQCHSHQQTFGEEPCAGALADPNPTHLSLSPHVPLQRIPSATAPHAATAPGLTMDVPAVVLTETDRQNVPSRICLHKTLGAKPFKVGQGTGTAILNGAARFPSPADAPATNCVHEGASHNVKNGLPQASSCALGPLPSGESTDVTMSAGLGDGECPAACVDDQLTALGCRSEGRSCHLGSHGDHGTGPGFAHTEGGIAGGALPGPEEALVPNAVALAGAAPRVTSQPCAMLATQDDIARAAALKEFIVDSTAGLLLESLETLHARLARVLFQHAQQQDRELTVKDARGVVEGHVASFTRDLG